MNTILAVFIACVLPSVFTVTRTFTIDENWVCNVKRSCLECLRLSQCSWCQAENRCFSRKLPTFEDFCRDNSTEYQNYRLSFMDNAKCSCAGGHLEENCYPPGVTEGPKCTGRGACICGRCACNPMPDPEHPTKMVMGEFCEFDNFSCEGPRCNEGPFLHNDIKNLNNETVEENAEEY
ncbi:integrin beta-6-like [Ostrinia furnacalis]|uniref:integrin beta-6-like n=1 Tax=Ostrinia furnacalis TaxID=93504 RepID=UPI00103EE6DB|nr:integrin beta-6-like [Ostrinia furnacalis]